MTDNQLKSILEVALLSSNEPLSIPQLQRLFESAEKPDTVLIRNTLKALQQDYTDRVLVLVQVAGGYRFQIRLEFAPTIKKLHEKRPPRYSRALLETLALIAYRQPITRGEIEEVRGVIISTNIVKTLVERDWVKVLGHKDVPGKPALYGTTKQFLSYFNLNHLSELPPLKAWVDEHKIDDKLSQLGFTLDMNPDRTLPVPIPIPVDDGSSDNIESA
jgi:segregation and condensation protein B